MPRPWGPNTVAGAEDIIYSRITGSNQLAQYLGLTQAAGIGSMLVPNSVQPVLVVNGETATPGEANTTDFITAGGHAFTPAIKSGFEFIPGDPTGLGNIALAAIGFWANSVLPFPIGALFSPSNLIDPAGVIVVRDVIISADRDSATPSNMYCGLAVSAGSAPTIVNANTIASDRESLSGFEGSGQLILGNITTGPGIPETGNATSNNWISSNPGGMMYSRVRDNWRPFESVTPFVLPLNRKIVGGQSENGASPSPGFGVSLVWQQIPIGDAPT